jgi:hypothetical protein
MNTSADRYVELLRAELRALGKNGGILTPSIYDTAQVLRHAPPADTAPVVEWLLRQQRSDGGWGDETGDNLPRHVPTLAAVLALRERLPASPEKHPEARRQQEAVQRGIDFLCKSAHVWGGGGTLPDDIPVGAELSLPMLLDEAAKAGIELPQEPFRALRALGGKRKQIIAKMNPPAGTAPVHTWEAWGTAPVSSALDGSHGVGHSPAATAHWLRLWRDSSAERTEDVTKAEQFLEKAAAATGVGIPGVVPTVWPIERFEQSWALFALYVLKQQQHPALQETVRAQFADLRDAVTPRGIGMSDHFVCDGDITATTLALLADTGHEVDANILNHFMRGQHFITYAHELQPSVTTTAHALLAFALLGRDTAPLLQILVERQDSDGTWAQDKWHKSWLYTTAQVMIALARTGETQALRKGVDALLARQHDNGGWGFGPQPTLAETAYAVHALFSLKGHPFFDANVRRALRRADQWMQARELAPRGQIETYWIGKELYCPYRVDRIFELTAMIALEAEREALAAA